MRRVVGEPHPLLNPVPVVGAGISASAAVLTGAVAPACIAAGLVAWIVGVGASALRPTSSRRPAAWRLQARWRRHVEAALTARDAHRSGVGTAAEADLIDDLVLDAWAIARWGDAAVRAYEGLRDGPDRARLRLRIVEADQRIAEIVDALRSAASAATARRIERDAPDELRPGSADLTALVDAVAGYRAALDEVDALP